MGRGRDEFWDHAEKLNGGKRFRCNYCGLKFGGGATRIKHHLSQLKGGDIQICSKVPEHVRLAAVRAIDPHDHGSFSNKKRKKKSNTASSSSSSQTEMGHKRKATTNYGRPDDDQIEVDTKLAKFMHLHDIPFKVAEEPLFDEFVKCVADFRSYYQQPPSRATLSRQLEYDVPKEVEKYTKDAEESLLQTGCTLLFHPSYDSLYAWTSKGLLFKGTLTDSDVDFSKWLSSKVRSLEPNNIQQLIIDCKYGVFYVEEIVKEVLIDYPWVWVTFCATRQITKFFMDVSDKMCSLTDKMCSLTTCGSLVFLYMERNHPSLLSLREGRSSAQSSSIVALACNIMEDNEISDFVMGFLRLKSLLEFEDKLQALEPPVHLSNASRFFYYVIRHREFWIRGKHVVHALHPLFEAFCLLISNNNVTVGYLYTLMQRANILIQRHENCCCYKNCIRTNFNEMYRRIISPIHAAAALLNPAYLCSEDFNEENKDLKEGIDFVLENIVQVEERDDFMTQLLTYRSKDPNLFTPSALALLNTSHPGVWWGYCGDCVPVLKKYALKIVTQPCSNFFSEEEMKSITRDKSNGRLRTKIMMMKKSVAPKSHPLKATKLVDQLVALVDMEPFCSQYDYFLELLPEFDVDTLWDSLEDPSFSFLDNLNKFL